MKDVYKITILQRKHNKYHLLFSSLVPVPLHSALNSKLEIKLENHRNIRSFCKARSSYDKKEIQYNDILYQNILLY